MDEDVTLKQEWEDAAKGAPALSLNYLSQTLPGSVGDMTHLTRIELEGAFTSLPNEITQLTNLKELLILAPVTTFPEGFDRLTALDTLTICTRGEIPRIIGKMTNLVSLDLGNNNLGQWPDISNLTLLTQLSLANNDIKEVPEGVFNRLEHLQCLELTMNRFKSISKSITKLSNLVSLRMAYNELTDLPNMEPMTNLKMVSIGGNPFSRVPATLTNLPNLERLEISKAGLKIIPPELSHLTNLTLLTCLQNKIEVFPPGVPSQARVMFLKASKFPPPSATSSFREFFRVNEDLYCT